MKKLCLLTVLLAATAVICSCRTPSAGITVDSYPSTQITVDAKMVGRRIKVVEYNARKRDGQLQVQITAQNVTKKDCQFEYRFQWLDKDGMSVDTTTTVWQPASISAMEKAFLKGMAPTRSVEDFVFIVRFSRPSTRW